MGAQVAAAEALSALKAMTDQRQLTPQRALFAWLQAGHESVWGVGYGAANQAVYNYGSITGVGPAGSFMHGDSSPGKAIEDRAFKRFHSASEGLAYFLNFTNSPSLQAALANQSAMQGCCALYERGYYENTRTDTSDDNAAGNIADYFNALRRQLRFYEASKGWGEATTILPDLAYIGTPANAKAAWAALFHPSPMRRRHRPRATLRSPTLATPSVAPLESSSKTIVAQAPKVENSPTPNTVFKLVLLEDAAAEPRNALISVKLDTGFTPWRYNP